MKKDLYRIFLLVVCICFWIWGIFTTQNHNIWLLENYAVFLSIPLVIYFIYKKMLNNVSLTCITIFFIMHIIGARYGYTHVPYEIFISDGRNMYDRVVHFLFGFLIGYPIFSLLDYYLNTKNILKFMIPVFVISFFAATYEVFEWLGTVINMYSMADFLATQGDIWDTQKDIFVALVGVSLTMIITYCYHFYRKSYEK